MTDALAKGSLTVGITIPPEFVHIACGRTAQVQALYDAVDANTANIASSYINQLVSDYNFASTEQPPLILQCRLTAQLCPNSDLCLLQFGVGEFLVHCKWDDGVVLTIVGSQTSSPVVREKQGTIEQ